VRGRLCQALVEVADVSACFIDVASVEDFQKAADVVKRDTGSVPAWFTSRFDIAAAEAAKKKSPIASLMAQSVGATCESIGRDRCVLQVEQHSLLHIFKHDRPPASI
jgi:hypothetical protein